jgi:hypothetical protein
VHGGLHGGVADPAFAAIASTAKLHEP